MIKVKKRKRSMAAFPKAILDLGKGIRDFGVQASRTPLCMITVYNDGSVNVLGPGVLKSLERALGPMVKNIQFQQNT